MRSSVLLAVFFTLGLIATQLVLRRLRLPSGVYRIYLDDLDPRNHGPKARWLILLAVALWIGCVVAWARVMVG